MSLTHRPRREDYFPKLRRGHGPRKYKRNDVVRVGCVDPGCQLNSPKSRITHQDQRANISEWCSDHRVTTTKQRPAFEAMVAATGGAR